MLPFMPEPDRVVLFGGGLLTLKRVLGMVHGFSGFAFIYGPYVSNEGEVILETDGPVFISEGGYFSDDPATLVAVGLSLDMEACKSFLEMGDYGEFVPVAGATRRGGRVRMRFSAEGMDIEESGEGGLNVDGEERPEKFNVLPDLLGALWRIKLATMSPDKKRRAYAIERWARGFAGLKRGGSSRTG